jgi:hypothetical protein
MESSIEDRKVAGIREKIHRRNGRRTNMIMEIMMVLWGVIIVWVGYILYKEHKK